MPRVTWLVMLLGCVLPLLLASAQTSPTKLASFARFELSGQASGTVITDADVLQGHAALNRPNLPGNADPTRQYWVEFPVFHFATNEIVLRFVPKGSGILQLRLSGFRDPFRDNVLFKEEVWWHRVAPEGALIPAEAWGGKPMPLRSWNQEAVELPLRVTRDTPVTLRIAAQAVRPPDFDEMLPIRAKDSPAHQAAKRFSHGVAITQYLELPTGDPKRIQFSAEEFVQIRTEGFDHVRLPVAWHLHLEGRQGSAVSTQFLAEVDALVAAAQKQGLGVILGFHGFAELTSSPVSGTARFLAIWEQVSRAYAHASESLAFELLDEPAGEVPTKNLMSIYAELIPLIRRHSQFRTLFVCPSGAGNFASLAKMRLPDGEDNLIVTLDCPEPALFTQQGRSSSPFRGVLFPGPPESPLVVPSGVPLTPDQSRWLNRYNHRPTEHNPSSPAAFRDLLAFAKLWSTHYGRPVYFGEVACHYQTDPVSRARYYHAFRTALGKLSLGWSIRGWKDDYRYWEEAERRPHPGLREALFSTTTPEWVRDRSKLRLSEATSPRARVEGPEGAGGPGRLSIAQIEDRMVERFQRALFVAVAVVCLLMLLVAVWLFRSQQRQQQQLDLVLPAAALPIRSVPLPVEGSREGLLRHVARLMVQTAIPRLVNQRRELLQLQERAAQDLSDLERRLEAVQAPLQDRMSAYERRIAELEELLAAKGQENEQLLTAKIQLTKQHLEALRARSSPVLGKSSLN